MILSRSNLVDIYISLNHKLETLRIMVIFQVTKNNNMPKKKGQRKQKDINTKLNTFEA